MRIPRLCKGFLLGALLPPLAQAASTPAPSPPPASVQGAGAPAPTAYLVAWSVRDKFPESRAYDLEQWQKSSARASVTLAAGFPRSEDLRRVLPPSVAPAAPSGAPSPVSYVVLLGACATEQEAKRVVAAIKATVYRASETRSLSIIPIEDGRPLSCPVIYKEPPCADEVQCTVRCELMEAGGCLRLRDQLAKRTPVDEKRIKALLDQACALGSLAACQEILAKVDQDSSLERPDARGQACKLGDKESCAVIDEYYQQCAMNKMEACSAWTKLVANMHDKYRADLKRLRSQLKDLCRYEESVCSLVR